MGFSDVAPGFARMILAAAAVAALTACGASQSQPASLQTVPIDPASSSGDLLYVSDASSGDVYVFSYPKGRLVGTLTGVDAWNLCGDRWGHVFVAVQAGRILEFAHGGTEPINRLRDRYYPIACSVDPVTGNLAVANESGSVSIYQKATGQPTVYNTPLIPLFCTYDSAGNLFVDSSGAPGIRIAELPKGGSGFSMVTYHGRNAGEPAGLQWVGNHLAVGGASPYQLPCCGRIFRFSVKDARGKLVAKTHVPGALSNFFVDGSTAIVTTIAKRVAFYEYPAGGRATKIIKLPGHESYGVVVSAAP